MQNVIFHVKLLSPTLNHVSLKSAKGALRSYLKLTYQYQFHILPNEKISAAKDHGKTT